MKAKRTTLVASIAVLLLMGSTIAFAGDIPISVDNPSFEVPNVGGVNNWNMYLQGWTQGPGTTAGVWQPDPALLTPSDGVNVAWIWNGYISQVLTTALEANSQYTLSVDVGERKDIPSSGYIVQLLAGGVVLAQDNSSLSLTPGSFLTSTVTYTSGSTGDLIGQNLEIRLWEVGGQAQFDNIRLTDPKIVTDNSQVPAVPEPATITLFAAGGAAVLRMTRRKRA